MQSKPLVEILEGHVFVLRSSQICEGLSLCEMISTRTKYGRVYTSFIIEKKTGAHYITVSLLQVKKESS